MNIYWQQDYMVLFSLQLRFLLEESGWRGLTPFERMGSFYLIRTFKERKENEKQENIAGQKHLAILATFHLILHSNAHARVCVLPFSINQE